MSLNVFNLIYVIFTYITYITYIDYKTHLLIAYIWFDGTNKISVFIYLIKMVCFYKFYNVYI